MHDIQILYRADHLTEAQSKLGIPQANSPNRSTHAYTYTHICVCMCTHMCVCMYVCMQEANNCVLMHHIQILYRADHLTEAQSKLGLPQANLSRVSVTLSSHGHVYVSFKQQEGHEELRLRIMLVLRTK